MDKEVVVVVAFMLSGIVALSPTNEDLARLLANRKRLLFDFSTSFGDAPPAVDKQNMKFTKGTSTSVATLKRTVKNEVGVSDDMTAKLYDSSASAQPKTSATLSGQMSGNSEYIFGSSLPSFPENLANEALQRMNPSSLTGSQAQKDEYVFGAALNSEAPKIKPVTTDTKHEVRSFGRPLEIFGKDSKPPKASRTKQGIRTFGRSLDMFSNLNPVNGGDIPVIKPDKPSVMNMAQPNVQSSNSLPSNTKDNLNILDRSGGTNAPKTIKSGRQLNAQVDLRQIRTTKPSLQSADSKTGSKPSAKGLLAMTALRQPGFFPGPGFSPFSFEHREMIPMMFDPRTRTFSPMMPKGPMMEVREGPPLLQPFPEQPLSPLVSETRVGPDSNPELLTMQRLIPPGFQLMDFGPQVSPMGLPYPDFASPQGQPPEAAMGEMPFMQANTNTSSGLPDKLGMNASQTMNSTASAMRNRMAMMEHHRQMYLCYKETPRAIQTVCSLKQVTTSKKQPPCALSMVCVEMQPGVGKCCARDRRHANMLEDYVEMNYPEHLH